MIDYRVVLAPSQPNTTASALAAPSRYIIVSFSLYYLFLIEFKVHFATRISIFIPLIPLNLFTSIQIPYPSSFLKTPNPFIALQHNIVQENPISSPLSRNGLIG
jgi:hypothetical protein